MTHKYKHKGFELPSVTTIIGDCTDKSEPLMRWAAAMVVEWIKQNCSALTKDETGLDSNIYDVWDPDLDEARFNFRKISKEALDVGSEVHHAIEHYLKSGKKPKGLSEQASQGFAAFLQWAGEHKLETKATEKKVFMESCAGTLDWEGKLDGKKTVIDFKTAKAFYKEYDYQIAAYRSCTDAEACGILRLDKETGLPEYKDTTKTYEKDLKIFNLMVPLYMARHPRIAKKAGWEE
jgi:hypothetical protein